LTDKREEQFLKLISSKSARDILKYLNRHDTAQHADLNAFMNAATLNTTLNELLMFDLIKHHLDKNSTRKESYTITEKGKKILQYLDDMIEVLSR
jgi:DNA-binding HxlR family transcriptional regulator